MRLLFQLGREPLLSEAEIRSVLACGGYVYTVVTKKDDVLLLDVDDRVSVEMLMRQLAGTIKISAALPSYQADVLGIATYLDLTQPTKKIEFSLSGPGANALALKVKNILKERERSVRYIEPKNTATILHNNLVERQTDLTIFDNALFVTQGIQPIVELSERDFGRPGFDAKSGMLPPKLARMMINLAETTSTDVLLDPFCGSGTVLTEALHVGVCNLIGSDLSERAVADTKKNVEWTIEKFQIPHANFQVFLQAAERLGEVLKPGSVDIAVSEPYMGKPLRGNESEVFLKKQIAELKELYIAAFRSLATVVKPGGRVVFVIPQFRVKDQWLVIDCVEEITRLGFTTIPFLEGHDSLLYWRKDQIVGRGIWRFVRY